MITPRLAVLLLAAPVCAQDGAPRFHVPATPHSYTTAKVPRGLSLERLLWRDNSLPNNLITDHGATLGRVLFYDKWLSRNRRTSCASCHRQARGFADPRPRSRGFAGRRTGRNSMALANLMFHETGRFFWDGRAPTLEEMVLMPIEDPIEMGMDIEVLLQRLNTDPPYRELNRKAFGTPEIERDHVARALAQFLRSMVTFGSKFDHGLAAVGGRVSDEFPNFTKSENRGKEVFLGAHDHSEAQSCASCHMQEHRPSGCGVPAGVRIPPLGPVLFQRPEMTNNGLDRGLSRDDPGLGGVTRSKRDLGRFRAPSLRNIELTGPYMHDGRLATLEDVVKFYVRGVRAHPALDVRLVTHAPPPPGPGWGAVRWKTRPKPLPTHPYGLHHAILPHRALGMPMTRRQQRDLVAFLKTLTDRGFVDDPRFSDPFLD